jgi:putative endopeptidase
MRTKSPVFALILSSALLLLSTVVPVFARHADVHGINPADMDLSVSPAVDFYRYANGGWLDRTPIPSDEGAYGNFAELEDRTRVQLLDLFHQLATGKAIAPGSDEEKALQIFQQGTDLKRRDALDIAPIQPILDEIAAISDLDDLHRFLQTSIFSGVGGPFPIYAYPDLKDSSMMGAYLSGPTYGLPNRDYYLEDDEANAAVRAAYIDTMATMLGFLGRDEAEAAAAAQAVYDLEHRLIEPTLTREEWQDLSLTYNPTSVSELSAQYPMMDWPAYLAALGLDDVDTLLVDEPKYLKALDQIVRQTPPDVLKDYLTLQVLWTFSDALGTELSDVAFAFQGRVLAGAEEQRPVDERVVEGLNWQMGEAVGKLYVDEYFPPTAKEEIRALVDDLRAAFRIRLENNTWMTPETQAKALEKLDKLGGKVGYPDHWRSYAAVDVGNSYAESLRNAASAETRRTLDQIGKPVDRTEWRDPPQTVNAFYSPENNEIVFPAAFLQPPYFDVQADPAVNFGSIGAVIGHEITHGFDLQGAQFDAMGNLTDWWTPEDYERFQALNDRVAAQYGAIEILPGLNIDGQITVTENVADLGGVQVAFDALQIHLAAQGDQTLSAGPLATPDTVGLTPEQRFFVACARAWRENTRDEFLSTQVKSDFHAPASIRATLPIRNMDTFYEAFAIEPGDPMYLPPEERIVIW